MRHRIFPQLDGLRGAAALLILAHHYWPGRDFWDPTGGRIGVDFFFVLSGFLITRSLLLDRRSSKESATTILKKFYGRRARRILPLFYVTCAIAMAFGWMRISTGLFWHLSFLSNFYFIKEGRFIGAAGHLWALAIEQHFYLFWPLILLYVPERFLRPAALAMIGTGVLFRACAGCLAMSSLTIDLITPDAFEALGAGALLACSPDSGSWLGAAGLALAVLRIMGHTTHAGYWFSLTATELSRALMLAWLIDRAVRGIPGRVGEWLASTESRALGHWSFAIYLSHNFVLCWTVAALGHWAPPPVIPFIALGLTLVWSMMAYHLIERPFSRTPKTHPVPVEIQAPEPIAVI